EGAKQTRSAKKARTSTTVGPSQRQAQRIRDIASRGISGSFPERINYINPSTGNLVKLHQNSRCVATADAGLYSSVLAAAVERARRRDRPDSEGIAEAFLIDKIVDKIVDDMSYARYVGYHIANVAICEAYSLDNEAMLKFYELFFRNGRCPAQNLW
ncbi:hypothetical protein DFQ30_002247, partial [Apophysomyces sp. BC1015]